MDSQHHKASAGQPFKVPPAEIWNGMVDAGEEFRRNRLSQGGGDPIRPRRTDIIKVRNDSGSARVRGEILGGFGGVLTDLTAETLWLSASAPSTGMPFGVLLKDVAIGGIEDLQLSGVCLAKVNVTDAGHLFAEVSGYKLASGTIGPIELVYVPGGVAEQICVVRFTGAPPPVVQTVVTDVRVNGVNLEYKRRDIYVWPFDDETDWEAWHIGAECDGA